jgi:hypothetical protein
LQGIVEYIEPNKCLCLFLKERANLNLNIGISDKAGTGLLCDGAPLSSSRKISLKHMEKNTIISEGYDKS